MGRSRYQITEPDQPHFVTCTVRRSGVMWTGRSRGGRRVRGSIWARLGSWRSVASGEGFGTRSVPGCIPTRSVGTRPTRSVGVRPTRSVGVRPTRGLGTRPIRLRTARPSAFLTNELAQTDPRGFLARYPDGAVIDEVQRCPDLMSYLQGWVDARGRMGDFVLTCSQQFGLMSRISQSLAGRVGRIELVPFAMDELAGVGRLPTGLDALLWQGGLGLVPTLRVGMPPGRSASRVPRRDHEPRPRRETPWAAAATGSPSRINPTS